jgi:hypothetical protein
MLHVTHTGRPKSRIMIRKFSLPLVLLVFSLAAESASAYWPYGNGGYNLYGYNWGFNQATNYIPSPPYYSVYPPVYYSHQITARHYGASPFAWTPGMEPITYLPDPSFAAASEPQIIENPYVTAKTSNKQLSAADKAPEPVKIANPFVVTAAR